MPRRIKSTELTSIKIDGQVFKAPTSWSLSRWAKYRDCPLWYRFDVVQRMPQRESRAMQRGIAIHQLAEQYLKGKISPIPDELANFEQEFKNLKKFNPNPEADWTITERGEQTYSQDWDNAWFRAKIDSHVYFGDERDEPNTLLIIDFKTGRPKEYVTQSEVYAWVSKIFYPEVEKVEVELWFLDHTGAEATGRAEFDFRKPSRWKELDKKWRERALKMLSDRKFPATPGKHCNYCPRRTDRGGTCGAWKHAA